MNNRQKKMGYNVFRELVNSLEWKILETESPNQFGTKQALYACLFQISV